MPYYQGFVWVGFGVALLGLFAWWLMHGGRRNDRLKRGTIGLCMNCGYDLRASHDTCPECGTPRHRVCSHCGCRTWEARQPTCPRCGAGQSAK